MQDSLFAGWLVQRQITKRLILGTEVYHQSAQAIGARHTNFAATSAGTTPFAES
jgi:hypothetical protein